MNDVSPAASSFFAQARHVDGQRVLIHKGVGLPQALHQPLTADDLALVFKEAGEDAVFILGQLDFLPVIAKRFAARVEHGAAMRKERRLRREVIAAAQEGAQLCHQHAAVKGLGDEIIRAHLHRRDDVHAVRRGGDEHDRHIGELPQLGAPVIPAEKRQRNVNEHDMRREGGVFGEDGAKVRDDVRLHLPCGSQLRHRRGDGGVVLDNQQFVHAFLRCGCCQSFLYYIKK